MAYASGDPGEGHAVAIAGAEDRHTGVDGQLSVKDSPDRVTRARPAGMAAEFRAGVAGDVCLGRRRAQPVSGQGVLGAAAR